MRSCGKDRSGWHSGPYFGGISASARAWSSASLARSASPLLALGPAMAACFLMRSSAGVRNWDRFELVPVQVPASPGDEVRARKPATSSALRSMVFFHGPNCARAAIGRRIGASRTAGQPVIALCEARCIGRISPLGDCHCLAALVNVRIGCGERNSRGWGRGGVLPFTPSMRPTRLKPSLRGVRSDCAKRGACRFGQRSSLASGGRPRHRRVRGRPRRPAR